MRICVLVAVLFPLTAQAGWTGCAPGQELRFQCSVKGGAKQVEVCQGDGVASYSFGRPNAKAELALSTPIEMLDYTPWNGVGRSIYEEVAFTNGDYLYTIYSTFDRLLGDDSEVPPIAGGVAVTKGDQTIATLDCDTGSVTQMLDGLYADKQDAGQCWSFESFSWTVDCPTN